MPYYLVYEDDKNKPCQSGPFETYGRALEAKDRLDRPAEIIKTKSRDPNTATREIKQGKIERVGFSEGSRRVRHPTMEEAR